MRRALPLPSLIMAMFVIAAAPPAEADLVRDGNDAYASGDFQRSLDLYTKAQRTITDPGLTAFNRAAVFAATGEHRQAENHLRMALADEEITDVRRAQGLFNLGNSLVRQAGPRDVKLLREAIHHYGRAIAFSTDTAFNQQVRHNLETAKLLWNKARAAVPAPPAPGSEQPQDADQPKPEQKNDSPPEQTGKNDKKPGKDVPLPKDGKIDDSKTGKDKDGEQGDAKKADISRVPVIPDSDQVEKQSPEDTRRALEFAAERLKNERRRQRMEQSIPEIPSGRDW